MNNPGRIHRAWWMLIGCCLLQGGSLGIVHNCRGIFYAPVIEDLGFGMGAFTFYVLFFGVCSCIVLPFVGTLFRRIDSRILLGGASLVFSGTVFAMGFFRTLPAFYIAGALQGFAGAFLMFYPAPYILGNWFHKKRGLAVGLAAAFSGIVGGLGNPLGNAIIRTFGWRVGFFSFGAISLLMMLPVSVFLLRCSPEDVGCRPYGAEDDEALIGESCPLDGVPASRAKRESAFWLLILAGLLASFTCSYCSHLSPIGIYFGYGSAVGALMVSCSMAGNVVGKLLLGHLYDRFGLRVSLAAGTAVAGGGLSPAAHKFAYGAHRRRSALRLLHGDEHRYDRHCHPRYIRQPGLRRASLLQLHGVCARNLGQRRHHRLYGGWLRPAARIHHQLLVRPCADACHGRAVHRIRTPRPEDRRGIQNRRERRSLIETIKKGWNYL